MSLIRRAKTLVYAILGIALLGASPAHAAGTTPLAMVPQVDSDGNKASGCLLYFYVAGTVASPQNAYQDFGLTQPLSNPLQCDQAGRVPMHWLADGLIHIRLTTFNGLQIIDTTMQVLGPSSGGGGGGSTVDPTTIAATGDVKPRYGTGPLSGWVRANGLTIGNATSGATERANADTQALFVYLYTTDPNLAVSGGRTGNALNDYNANKTIVLPSGRGRALFGLADMGNVPTTLLDGVSFESSGTPTTLGSRAGASFRTITTTNLPPYTPSGSVSGTFTASNPLQAFTGTSFSGSSVFATNANGTNYSNYTPTGNISATFTGTPAAGQNSTPMETVSPLLLLTIYMKL